MNDTLDSLFLSFYENTDLILLAVVGILNASIRKITNKP